jgi:predicted outer membrane protein
MKTSRACHSAIWAVCALALAQNSTQAQSAPGHTDPADRPLEIETQRPPVESPNPAAFAQSAFLIGTEEIEISNLAIRKSENVDVKGLASILITEHLQVNRQLAEIARKEGILLPNLSIASAAGENATVAVYETLERDQKKNEADKKIPGKVLAPIFTGSLPVEPTQPGLIPTPVDTLPSGRPVVIPPANADGPSGEVEAPNGNYSYAELRQLTGERFNRAYVLRVLRDHSREARLFTRAAQLTDPELREFANATLPLILQHQTAAHKVAWAIGVEGPDPSQRSPQVSDGRQQ